MTTDKKDKALLMLKGIITLALLLRTIAFIKSFNDMTLTGDALHYITMARQLVERKIYGYGSVTSNAYVTPGYPLFLSGIYFAFGGTNLSINVTRVIQLFVGGFTPALSYMVANKFSKRKDVSLLTALLVAVYPTYVKSTTLILTEVWALAMMLLYFYVYLEALERRNLYLYGLSGFVFAAEILIRPVMLPLFILPFIFTLISRTMGIKAVLKTFVYSCLGFVVLMLPWWTRNLITLHQLILLSTSAGDPLLAGTYPFMKGLFKDVPPALLNNSQYKTAYAIERIKRGFEYQPLVYLYWFTIGKTKNMFIQPWLYGEKLKSLAFYFHWMISIGGLMGFVINSFHNKKFIFLSIYALAFLSLYLMFIPTQRYAYQLLFFAMLSLSYLLCLICDKVKFKPYFINLTRRVVVRVQSSNIE